MIIYFSGTGNSLYIAKKLAEKLNDEIIHINEAAKLGEIKDNQVGIVFPIYCGVDSIIYTMGCRQACFKRE